MKRTSRFLSKQGFTLLELSLVILIISLITGGIILSQSLIRSSKIHAMLGEYDVYLKATQEFVDKYQAMPGDMVNASSLWDAASCASVATRTNAAIGVCDGDGDGKIESGSETWGAWRHLYKAGLISVPYVGLVGSDLCNYTRKVNVPDSQLAPGAWVLQYLDYHSGVDNGLWPALYGNSLMMGAVKSDNSVHCYQLPYGAVLLPVEAYEIDKKIDDGKPALGKVRTWNTRVSTPYIADYCTTSDSSAANAIYNNDYTDFVDCALIFVTGL